MSSFVVYLAGVFQLCRDFLLPLFSAHADEDAGGGLTKCHCLVKVMDRSKGKGPGLERSISIPRIYTDHGYVLIYHNLFIL